MRGWHVKPIHFLAQRYETWKMGVVFTAGGFVLSYGRNERVFIFRYSKESA